MALEDRLDLRSAMRIGVLGENAAIRRRADRARVRRVETLDVRSARAIGEAAFRRVIAEHTYAHRAAQLEALLEGRTPARPLLAELER